MRPQAEQYRYDTGYFPRISARKCSFLPPSHIGQPVITSATPSSHPESFPRSSPCCISHGQGPSPAWILLQSSPAPSRQRNPTSLRCTRLRSPGNDAPRCLPCRIPCSRSGPGRQTCTSIRFPTSPPRMRAIRSRSIPGRSFGSPRCRYPSDREGRCSRCGTIPSRTPCRSLSPGGTRCIQKDSNACFSKTPLGEGQAPYAPVRSLRETGNSEVTSRKGPRSSKNRIPCCSIGRRFSDGTLDTKQGYSDSRSGTSRRPLLSLPVRTVWPAFFPGVSLPCGPTLPGCAVVQRDWQLTDWLPLYTPPSCNRPPYFGSTHR